MTAPVSAPVVVTHEMGSDDDDLLHLVCDCDEDTAMCGAAVPGDCWMEDGLECVVCEDLRWLPCERCGL